ncbi:MAG TPA: hypothetical protein IAC46_04520 [Candidatus Onthoplasma faecigallinarum]|nr:hypothetical protein [Candidatus Onthoplasma faecigallinarum]
MNNPTNMIQAKIKYGNGVLELVDALSATYKPTKKRTTIQTMIFEKNKLKVSPKKEDSTTISPAEVKGMIAEFRERREITASQMGINMLLENKEKHNLQKHVKKVIKAQAKEERKRSKAEQEQTF